MEIDEQCPILLTGCGSVATGVLDQPLVDADTILVEGEMISAVGRRSDIEAPSNAIIVDAAGLTAIPGLIDTHLHPSFGDYSWRTRTADWMAGYLQAGITTGISQGSFLLEGYPTDRVGMLALGVALARSYSTYRPGHMKMHAASISLVEGLTEDDFRFLAGEGVNLISEIGVLSIVDPEVVRPMLEIAHRHGFISRVHFGPKAVPGSYTVSAEDTKAMGVQIAAHVNGGPAAPPMEDVTLLVEETDCWLEICDSGNVRMAVDVARDAQQGNYLDRVMLGTDSPHGSGATPRGVLRLLTLLCAATDISAPEAIALASGNSAIAYRLDTGRIAAGMRADILLIDAPRDVRPEDGIQSLENGDIPSISMIMTDGEIRCWQSANTLPGKRTPQVLEA